MKQVARLRRHVGDVACPHRNRQQHDVHGGKAGDGEALQQPFGLRALVCVDALGRERMSLIAHVFYGLDDRGRVDFIVTPIHGKPALGEVEPRIDDARQFCQPSFDLADAAGAGDAVHGERHVRGARIAPFNKHGEIKSFGHRGRSPDYDAVLGTEQPVAVAREFDDEVPLAGGNVRAAAKMAGAILSDGDGAIEAPVGRPREPGGCGHAGEGRARSVARDDIEQRAAVGCGRHLGIDPPMLRVLGFGHGDIALEHLAGLIGTHPSQPHRKSTTLRAP